MGIENNCPAARWDTANVQFDQGWALGNLLLRISSDGERSIGRKRRRSRANPNAVIVVFASYLDLDQGMSAAQLKAAEILTKPIPIPDLLSVIHERLQEVHRTAGEGAAAA